MEGELQIGMYITHTVESFSIFNTHSIVEKTKQGKVLYTACYCTIMYSSYNIQIQIRVSHVKVLLLSEHGVKS